MGLAAAHVSTGVPCACALAHLVVADTQGQPLLSRSRVCGRSLRPGRLVLVANGKCLGLNAWNTLGLVDCGDADKAHLRYIIGETLMRGRPVHGWASIRAPQGKAAVCMRVLSGRCRRGSMVVGRPRTLTWWCLLSCMCCRQ